MNSLHSLLFQKGLHTPTTPLQAVDLVDTFNFVCSEIDFPNATETKDVTTTDFKDEDGEDVYIPQRMRVKAFDLDVKVACVGNIGQTEGMLRSLSKWLCEGLPRNGDGLTIWSALYNRGYRRCYFKGASDLEYSYMNESEILECTLKFRICDPTYLVELKKESATIYRLM